MSKTFDYLCPFCGDWQIGLITIGLQHHFSVGVNNRLFPGGEAGCDQVTRWWATDFEVTYLLSCCVPVVLLDVSSNERGSDGRRLHYFPTWLRPCLEAYVPQQRRTQAGEKGSWATDDYGSMMRAVIEEVGPSPELQRSILTTFALGGHEALRKLYKPTPIMIVKRDHKLCVGSV